MKLQIELTIVYDLEVPDEEWERPDDEALLSGSQWPRCADCGAQWNPAHELALNDRDAIFTEALLESVSVGGATCLAPIVDPDGILYCECPEDAGCPLEARRRMNAEVWS